VRLQVRPIGRLSRHHELELREAKVPWTDVAARGSAGRSLMQQGQQRSTHAVRPELEPVVFMECPVVHELDGAPVVVPTTLDESLRARPAAVAEVLRRVAERPCHLAQDALTLRCLGLGEHLPAKEFDPRQGPYLGHLKPVEEQTLPLALLHAGTVDEDGRRDPERQLQRGAEAIASLIDAKDEALISSSIQGTGRSPGDADK
jgi:hypothetical protein